MSSGIGLSTHAAGQQAILLIYDGPQDKPVNPILIADSLEAAAKLKSEYAERFRFGKTAIPVVVDADCMRAFIRSIHSYGQRLEPPERKYASVEVVAETALGREDMRMFVPRTISLIDEFTAACHDSQATAALTTFRTTIHNWERVK